MLPGKIIGYALNSGGGWTGDLVIADWHDIENSVASEGHVKDSAPKKLESANRRRDLDFFAQMFP